MQQQVTISMQYQAWLDMVDRLEQIITKIESGTEVTDPGAVSELEQIRGILSSPLTVQDSVAQTELSLIKEKLEDIETRLNGTLTTQLTGSNVPEGEEIPVSVINSKIAQPIDLQYHDIKDSDPIPTKQVGNTVSILKKYEGDNFINYSNMRYGDNRLASSSAIIPVNYSNHTKKSIYIKNTLDVNIGIMQILVHFDLEAGGVTKNMITESITLEPGSDIIISKEIDVQCLGVSIQLARGSEPPTTGSITVIFLGGN